jgi:transposase-like protein
MTLTHSFHPTILRQDARGRIRFSREHKAAIRDEFAQSGMTGIAFAAHVGVKYPTFAGWLRHERVNRGSNTSTGRRPAASQAPPSFQFDEAESAVPDLLGLLELELSVGGVVRIRAASLVPLVAQLIKSLRPC